MVRTAQREDLVALRKIDCDFLPSEWHAPLEFYEIALHRNPEVFRVYLHKDCIEGYYSIFPLPNDSFQDLMEGILNERQVAGTILSYQSEIPVNLYIGSVVISKACSHSFRARAELLADIRPIFYTHGSVTVNEVGTFAVTTDGKRVVERFGLSMYRSLPDGSTAYRTPFDEIPKREEKRTLDKTSTALQSLPE